MRKVVIESWCDECAAKGTETRGEPIDITWRNREVALDLCEKHGEPFREVDRMVEAYGHNRKRKANTPPQRVLPTTNENGEKSYICPECGFAAVNAQGLGAHRRYH